MNEHVNSDGCAVLNLSLKVPDQSETTQQEVVIDTSFTGELVLVRKPEV